MKKFLLLVLAGITAVGTLAATYGPWGDSDAVKNPDKLGPTYLMNMPLTINGAAAQQGDCVAVYRQDTSALCGLGKVLDSSGKLTLVCYAPQLVVLHFKVWLSSSGMSAPKIYDCAATCDLLAPAPGSFYSGHTLVVVDNEPIIVNSPITYTNLKGATHTNPSTYQEGAAVTFSAPSEVTGYTFAGWTPSGITASMKGSQSVQANWQAHTYTIAYSGNGGVGHMSGTAATYDQDATVAGNGFTRGGFEFQGWALVATGEVAYVPGAIVRNLSAQQGGVVTLYAVWELSLIHI